MNIILTFIILALIGLGMVSWGINSLNRIRYKEKLIEVKELITWSHDCRCVIEALMELSRLSKDKTEVRELIDKACKKFKMYEVGDFGKASFLREKKGFKGKNIYFGTIKMIEEKHVWFIDNDNDT